MTILHGSVRALVSRVQTVVIDESKGCFATPQFEAIEGASHLQVRAPEGSTCGLQFEAIALGLAVCFRSLVVNLITSMLVGVFATSA